MYTDINQIMKRQSEQIPTDACNLFTNGFYLAASLCRNVLWYLYTIGLMALRQALAFSATIFLHCYAFHRYHMLSSSGSKSLIRKWILATGI